MEKTLKFKSAVIFSIIYSIIVISICFAFNRNFFETDDAVNEMIGFYKQYGKIWSEGHIPFIVDSMFVGGNGMIELGKGIFLPQTIIASLATHYFNISIIGKLLALINLSLVTLSGIYLAKSFNIRTFYCYLFATFITIQPIFLYQYSAGWWNAANGQAWATVCITLFMLFRNQQSVKYALLNFLSIVFLLSAGWPHGVIGYGFFVFAVLLFDFVKNKSVKQAIILISPIVFAIIFAIPVYSEYVISHELISRPNGFNNFGNFLSPSWSAIIMGFSPSYYDYIHYFGGYRIMFLSIGFSTIFFPYIFFYRDILAFIKKDKLVKLILLMISFYFLLSQMPSQFGSLRYSFRFIPFLSLSISLLTIYILDKAEKNNKSKAFILFLCITFILSSSMIIGEETKYLLIQIAFTLILIFFTFLLNNLENHKILLSSSIFSLLIMLSGLNTLGNGYVAFEKLPVKITNNGTENLQGFMLSFIGHNEKISINDLSSSQFGAYDIKSINGYSPVGNKSIESLLPYPSPHAIFQINPSLDNILKLDQTFNQCLAVLMKISTINIAENDVAAYKERLVNCGYSDIMTTSHNDVDFMIPKEKSVDWDKLPPIVSDSNVAVKSLAHTNNTDLIELGARNQAVALVFPRVWWHGYTAKFNGMPLPVTTDDSKILVRVDVPAGQEGRLELAYFPSTWTKLWELPLISILLMSGLILFLTKRKSV